MKALVPTRIDRGLPLSTNVPVGRRYTYVLGGGASAPLDPEAHAGCTSSRTARSSTGQAGLGLNRFRREDRLNDGVDVDVGGFLARCDHIVTHRQENHDLAPGRLQQRFSVVRRQLDEEDETLLVIHAGPHVHISVAAGFVESVGDQLAGEGPRDGGVDVTEQQRNSERVVPVVVQLSRYRSAVPFFAE